MPKVDIVIPCYNYGRFLEACVQSVLDQSVADVRVLIIDDASYDDSLAVANKLAKRDARVSVVSHSRNMGHISTFNEGIAWASADYFLLLSADDLLVPGALERASNVMDNNLDVVLTYGDCITWRDDLPLLSTNSGGNFTYTLYKDFIRDMCSRAGNLIPTPTAIVRTSTQKTIGGYRAFLPHTGDLEMWLRFATHGIVARIDAVQAIYRKHSTAMSNLFYETVLADHKQRKLAFDNFFAEYGERLAEAHSLQVQVRRALAEQVLRRSIKHLRHLQIKDGLRALRWSITLEPQLPYGTSLRQLLRLPGPIARARAALTVKNMARKFVGRC